MIQTRPSNISSRPLFVFLGRKGKPRRNKKKHTTTEISTNNQTNGNKDGLEGKTKGKGKKKSKQALSSKQTSNSYVVYILQGLIYIKSMLVICPFDIATLHRIILML
jgi:hypothetical protein